MVVVAAVVEHEAWPLLNDRPQPLAGLDSRNAHRRHYRQLQHCLERDPRFPTEDLAQNYPENKVCRVFNPKNREIRTFFSYRNALVS